MAQLVQVLAVLLYPIITTSDQPRWHERAKVGRLLKSGFMTSGRKSNGGLYTTLDAGDGGLPFLGRWTGETFAEGVSGCHLRYRNKGAFSVYSQRAPAARAER